MNRIVPLFDAGDLVRRPVREAAPVKVTACHEEMTGAAGAVLWGVVPGGAVPGWAGGSGPGVAAGSSMWSVWCRR